MANATAAAPGMMMDSERMRREILNEVKQLRNRNNAFQAQQFVDYNKNQGMKQQAAQDFFQLLADNGVDPSDLASINDFLTRIESTDPDLFVMFERAFQSLFEEQKTEISSESTEENSGSGMMDRFQNLAGMAMRG